MLSRVCVRILRWILVPIKQVIGEFPTRVLVEKQLGIVERAPELLNDLIRLILQIQEASSY